MIDHLHLGGELLEAYDSEGEEGVLRFVEEKILPLLNNEGEKAERIRFSDYSKWMNTQVIKMNAFEIHFLLPYRRIWQIRRGLLIHKVSGTQNR